MIRIHYTEDLDKGDRVLARFEKGTAFGEYWVKDIKDGFVGLTSREYSSIYNYHKIDEIEIYKDVK